MKFKFVSQFVRTAAVAGAFAMMATAAAETGTVKMYNGAKGYGMITPDNGADIFFDNSSIEMAGHKTPRWGKECSMTP